MATSEIQVTPSSLCSLGADRTTETTIDDESTEKKRQNDDNKEEQNNNKKRITNREPKQVEEKLLLEISDNQFKKRKQMNTKEQVKEECRKKWKSRDE